VPHRSTAEFDLTTYNSMAQFFSSYIQTPAILLKVACYLDEIVLRISKLKYFKSA